MAGPLAPPRPIPEPLLDIDDIQGNILAGFNKDFQQLIAIKIRSVPEARRWLARILPHISSMREVQQFNELFRVLKGRLRSDPQNLKVTWMNLAFSHAGIAKLWSAADADLLPDESFRSGLDSSRSAFLSDPVAAGESDPTAKWVVGNSDRPADIFMIVASDDCAELKRAVDSFRPGQDEGSDAPEIVWEELGETRTDLPGHEHFGFKDGVSQPGVRGLISRSPKTYLTKRLLKSPPAGTVEFSKPGQPLVWPGHFVLGYPFGSRDDGSPQPPARLARKWFKNGSFLVFRRLNQNVPAFSAFLRSEAARLSDTSGFSNITPERLGALLVGRWASGAPLSRAPQADNPELALDALSNNDFLFTQDTPAPDFLPESGGSAGTFGTAKEGSNGPICPHAAHIFKVNPRDMTTDLGPDFDTLGRRILRRGIPFGKPLENPMGADDGVPRGLHFLCYQASIVDQFETLQQNWANNIAAPTAGGHDLIIGQTPTAVRSIDLAPIAPGGSGETVSAPIQWVTPSGGGYFFAPAISAIGAVVSSIAGTSPG